ncbi:MAG: protein-glutamate O-methyltransferase CheR [Verrucomicrobiota bacterium]
MPPIIKANIAEAEACQYIATLVYDRCRIRLHEGKDALIKARLGKRMRKHGFPGLPEYCDFLRTQADEEEFTKVIDALTTNFTNFLREAEHFKFLVEQALPSMPPKGRKDFRIWSAASSSGEEPFTIGLYLSDHYPPALGWDWRIIASDISTKVLEQARQGIYPTERLDAVPRPWLHKYFQKGLGRWEGCCRVKPSITERVSFQQINLIESYTHPQPFEVIFCRNVMIYFDRPTQEQLVNRLCRFLVPQGYLLIGHSESLNGLNVPLRCLRPSIYQRSPA